MWYGIIYYICFFFFLFIIIIYFLRLFYINTLFSVNNVLFYFNILLSFFTFFTFLLLITIYFSFEIFFNYLYNFNYNYYYINFYDNNLNYYSTINGNLNLIYVYYFPFIYIFILITILAILFCLAYNINEIISFTFYCFFILIAGSALFYTDSLIIFFFAYEMLLIPSFFILYKFAKTRRCVEAAYLMFFWTQFGALFLLFSFLYIFLLTHSLSFNVLINFNFSLFEINFLFICWIIGFGVKLPIWPFYGWLPKAHVEASTNFSIFLSGVLVKFAFFGLLKCLITVQLEPTFYYIYPFLVIGITDAVFKLFYQIDLKKLVAYSTVIEMHWLTICIISGQSCLLLANFCMLISHALLSTNSFLLVDAINRRFKTRLITEITGINFLCPKLFLVSLINCLVFLGFPGSIFFIAEFLFFSFFFDLFPLLAIFLIFLLYLFGPIFFFRNWFNALFGLSNNVNKTIPIDLNSKELILYGGIIGLMFWLGFTWQMFLI
uniref:NADH-ubiquinone oxidoreductase chain 4 n=1 Tax=Pseudourostyla cristata TaxID=293816 RepID=A0A4P9JLD7_9SPIT|nr:NADH dehydrogenase subunit 4 [Pseudourostyla cristata]